jgi:hypothetical protein
VAMEKGVMPNLDSKMDAAIVEAMLSESGLNTKNSRVLFKHLNQFFGHSFFGSEKKRREYFAGHDPHPQQWIAMYWRTKLSFTSGLRSQMSLFSISWAK